ncbi:MAG: hypothetical protein GF316_11615 [Candidatus Lokiarchaeota archaeon]|nr:hypothetical protein [Candidatus Lokiarchaeota archaeon]
MSPCPIPTTDGSGDKWKDELHFIGGWNVNEAYYNPNTPNYKGPVKKQHMVYNYDADEWHFETQLPGNWHHGGTRATEKYLWRFLGTIDEDIDIRSKNPHTNKIFRWDGVRWEKMTPAPVRKMNFGTVVTDIGPDL